MDKIINGYELLEDFHNRNAGFCRWTKAKKEGSIYFLKEFLNPVYPLDEMIDDDIREKCIQICCSYEKEKCTLYSKINDICDGNLVRINEFFRFNSHYYIAMENIECEKIDITQIANMAMEDIVLLCMTIAHSVMKLHEAKIVHADIKESNILLYRTFAGKIVGKIIDFDCSFFEYNPPDSESDLGGDQIYLSPEACMFMCGENVRLTVKSDVFSLGILFHQYFAGTLPGFNHTQYDYVYEAVLDGFAPELSDKVPEKYRNLLSRMLIRNQDERCDMREVFCVFSGKKDIKTVQEKKNLFFVGRDLE